jgi:uncharacterized protein
MIAVEIAGEEVCLRPDRTAYWPARRTLLLADPHFGKAAAFRAGAVPIPGDCASSLMKLSEAVSATAAERLVILGDFWHARDGCTDAVQAELTTWRARHAHLAIVLVRGNHDSAPPPRAWAAHWHAGPVVDFPFVYSHHPATSDAGYTLAGHLHPGVRLAGRGRQRVRLPCFVIGGHGAILPAFGAFTGLADVPPEPGVRLFALAEGTVVPLPDF